MRSCPEITRLGRLARPSFQGPSSNYCKDVKEKDDVSSELQTLRDAIAKVELGEMSIKDLGLNAAEFREAKRLANIA